MTGKQAGGIFEDVESTCHRYTRERTPLTAAVSRDEGKTWQNRKALEDDPEGCYCYCAIDFVGDHVLLGHCAGDYARIGGLNLTQITRIDLDWLYR